MLATADLSGLAPCIVLSLKQPDDVTLAECLEAILVNAADGQRSVADDASTQSYVTPC
jgi:hypothetical protein